MSRTTRRGRFAAAMTGLAASLALIGAADASAATADGTGGVLTYTATPGAIANAVEFDETAPGTVEVSTSDADAIVAPSGSCSAGGGATTTCTGITSIRATTGDGHDEILGHRVETIPIGADGGAGNDAIQTGGGNDTILGGTGDDLLRARNGADRVDGGSGDDQLLNENLVVVNGPSPAPTDTGDVYIGGPGFDAIFVFSRTLDLGASASTSNPVSVTLDDAADDGSAGEGDDVRSDVEGVSAGEGGAGEDDTLVGSAAANDLFGGPGNDTIDGGRGNDVLRGSTGDDVITSRDGFADVVTCGPGADLANVDTLDDVADDCETISRRDVGNANEDRPPTLEVSSPLQDANLPTDRPTSITANVADDRGVAQVLFLANGRVICTDTVAPYTCDYQPTGADIGRTALAVVAIDAAQQTTTVIRSVTVGAFSVRGLATKLAPGRDTRSPFRFTMTGEIALPPTVTATQGCRAGIVSVQVKAGTRTISTRRATITRSCTFRSTVVFRDRSRFRGARSLKFTARFGGNTVLARSGASSRTARVR